MRILRFRLPCWAMLVLHLLLVGLVHIVALVVSQVHLPDSSN